MIRIHKKAIVPNSLSVMSKADFVVKINSKKDLVESLDFAKKEKLPFIPVGSGTNILPSGQIKAVVGIIRIKGIKQKGNIFEVNAGEIWDDFVKRAVGKGYAGIETLSLIPGRVGACSIQNIGAYGTEAKDTIKFVRVYDRKKEKFITLNNKRCKFGYRTSIFKLNPQRFVITSAIFELKKTRPKIPNYKDLFNYFDKRKNKFPSVKQIRLAVIKIRKSKLPDYKKIPNAGSYFINPFLDNKKIYAGRLIEETGLKGAKIGKMQIWPQNALVLTNPNRAGFREIMRAEKIIINKVFQKFGILLEREPVVL